MIEEDFQITIKGKFVPCWVCGATRDDGNYASYTTCRMMSGQLFITPHRAGCPWSEEAGDGQVTEGLAHSLYGGDGPWVRRSS